MKRGKRSVVVFCLAFLLVWWLLVVLNKGLHHRLQLRSFHFILEQKLWIEIHYCFSGLILKTSLL